MEFEIDWFYRLTILEIQSLKKVKGKLKEKVLRSLLSIDLKDYNSTHSEKKVLAEVV
jgi:hypothetical protein